MHALRTPPRLSVHAAPTPSSDQSPSLAMPLKQSSILARRYSLSTPEGSRLSRRKIISRKRSAKKTSIVQNQKRLLLSPRILRQLDIQHFFFGKCPALPEDVWRLVMTVHTDGKRARRAACISHMFAMMAREHEDNVVPQHNVMCVKRVKKEY